MRSGLFRAFLSGLKTRTGYCVDCLSRLFGEPAGMVSGYLRQSGIEQHVNHCENCGEHRETFRASRPVSAAP
jgi:hypothetical protein